MQSTAGMPRRDGPLALLSLVAFALCAILFAGMLAYCGLESAIWKGPPLATDLLAALALAAGGGTLVWLSRANARGCVSARVVMVCVAGLLAAVVGSWVWLRAPMHDLALAMGMHDRWCSAVDDNGASYHFLRAETAPSILFGPLIALIAWRGWFVARRTVRR